MSTKPCLKQVFNDSEVSLEAQTVSVKGVCFKQLTDWRDVAFKLSSNRTPMLLFRFYNMPAHWILCSVVTHVADQSQPARLVALSQVTWHDRPNESVIVALLSPLHHAVLPPGGLYVEQTTRIDHVQQSKIISRTKISELNQRLSFRMYKLLFSTKLQSEHHVNRMTIQSTYLYFLQLLEKRDFQSFHLTLLHNLCIVIY